MCLVLLCKSSGQQHSFSTCLCADDQKKIGFQQSHDEIDYICVFEHFITIWLKNIQFCCKQFILNFKSIYCNFVFSTNTCGSADIGLLGSLRKRHKVNIAKIILSWPSLFVHFQLILMPFLCPLFITVF